MVRWKRALAGLILVAAFLGLLATMSVDRSAQSRGSRGGHNAPAKLQALQNREVMQATLQTSNTLLHEDFQEERRQDPHSSLQQQQQQQPPAKCPPPSTPAPAVSSLEFFKADTVNSLLVGEAWDTQNIYSAFRRYRITRLKSQDKDHTTMIQDAVKQYVEQPMLASLAKWTFKLGLMWTSQQHGMQYRLLFAKPDPKPEDPKAFIASVSRPFNSPLQVTGVSMVSTPKQEHSRVAVMTLTQSRLKALTSFLQYTGQLLHEHGFTLLVVAVTHEADASFVEQIRSTAASTAPNLHLEVEPFAEPFRRGACLHQGIQAAKRLHKDPLLFLVDVDVIFTPDFLLLCSGLSSRNHSTYFPVTFSMYRGHTELNMRDSSGEWRIYGYGMGCMHASDYTRAGGFSLNIHGWGMEDEDLVHKFISLPNMVVYRSIDRSTLHKWHEKKCDHQKLGPQQLLRCYQSAVQYDGNKFDVARLYGFFKAIGVDESVLQTTRQK